MVSEEKLERINELARKSKSVGLTDEEKAEQAALRQEYIENFRNNFKAHLEMIRFED
ncbi:MAG: DUF896 domain-containing protein [Clostridiales Family XIII bacterium]|nr:DUF896 domain-containing protein [Clostridiales Family XIII bacterium]